MSESAEALSVLLTQLSKVVRTLSEHDIKRVASGEIKPVLVAPGQRIVETTLAVTNALRAVSQLTPEQLQQLEDRQGKLTFLPKGAKIDFPLDLVEAVADIAKFTTEEEVVRYLDADSRLNPTNLKKLATEMNVTIPSTVKTKSQLQLHIAERAIRDRGRWSWR